MLKPLKPGRRTRGHGRAGPTGGLDYKKKTRELHVVRGHVARRLDECWSWVWFNRFLDLARESTRGIPTSHDRGHADASTDHPTPQPHHYIISQGANLDTTTLGDTTDGTKQRLTRLKCGCRMFE